MNKRIVWSTILVPFLVISLTFTVGCEKKEPTPKQYVPKYSADQVIAVVKAQYPTSFKREWSESDGRFRTLDTPTQISVQFVGGTSHAWKATITSPQDYYLDLRRRTRGLIVYFWESDGGLHQEYVP